MTAEFCVCCGDTIPEGRQVCPNCEQGNSQNKNAIKFYKTQLNRCRINLFAAKQRNDTKAAENIERKMQIYEYTVEVLKNQ